MSTKKMLEVLTPSTYECENRVFADNQVKVRPVRWVLIQYNWHLYKKGKSGHADRLVQGEHMCKDGDRDQGDTTET